MKLFPATERREEAGDPKNFTGSVTVSRINEVCDEPLVNLYRVVFQPRARTAWHIHTGPQLLLVLAGCCRLQKKGEPFQEICAGGTVLFLPGEKHWHGAAPSEKMIHIALNINVGTKWLEKVTENQYEGKVK